VKARTEAKVFIHCDGAIEEILPDFIEIGIDILNPLQTSAKGMDPKKIKARFGKDLCFWGGGVETQTTLPFGTLEQIRREVRDRVALLSEGGGFVFGTIHNIQPDIPPEKILAVFDTAQET
jgi:uroporphyrinogen decarboxylase